MKTDEKKYQILDYLTILRTGTTCKKIHCYISESFCTWHLVKIGNLAKHF